MSRKIYPKKVGDCQLCGIEIIAKNSGWNKPNRKFCSNKCKSVVSNRNRVWKQSSKDKVGKANSLHKRTLEQRLAMSLRARGEKGSNWQGGITDKNIKIRNSIDMRLWRETVFKRDGYQCVWGGKVHGNKLHADHIKPFSLYPELRFAIDNGRTLCEACHRSTETYAGKIRTFMTSASL
jgi:5-methylcytosine-specific restriction endonuclease McrA